MLRLIMKGFVIYSFIEVCLFAFLKKQVLQKQTSQNHYRIFLLFYFFIFIFYF